MPELQETPQGLGTEPVQNRVGDARIQQGLRNNRHLSERFEQLAQLQLQNPELSKAELDLDAPEVPLFMKSYGYFISPWPVVINRPTLAHFDHLCAMVPKILDKVLRKLAETDRQYLLDYLNISELQLSLCLQRPIDTRDILCRYDAVISKGVTKLIELNIGSMIGGMHLKWMSPQALKLLKQQSVSATWDLADSNGYDKLFGGVIDSAKRLKGDAVTGNCAFFIPVNAQKKFFDDTVDSLKSCLRMQYKEALPAHLQDKGDLYFCNALEGLSLSAENKLFFDGVEMDAIVLSADEEEQIPISLYNMLETAVVDGQFYYADSISYTLLGLKLLLALVHEAKVNKFLTPEERQIVKNNIPFSTRLSAEFCLVDGKMTPVKTLVEEQKDRFVIKKSLSMQGNDVVVGESVDMETWLSLYEKHKHDTDWLLQEMCTPDEHICADPINGVGLYKMVWGLFSYSGTYCGAFIRAMHEQGDTIINSSRGANEFFVLEEQAYKNKISL